MNLWAHRRSQSAPLIDRQHFDLQQRLLHGDTNHNRHIDIKQGRRRRTFKTSHPVLSFLSFLLLSFLSSLCHVHKSFKAKYPHYATSCLSVFSFIHPLVFSLDGFHGCCVNCLHLCSLLTSSVPLLIYLFSLHCKRTGSKH